MQQEKEIELMMSVEEIPLYVILFYKIDSLELIGYYDVDWEAYPRCSKWFVYISWKYLSVLVL